MEVTEVSLRKESRDRYLTYALSVITGRALPDVRDGLKPVQRRILYTMFKNLRLKPESSHRKSAAVVGEVLGRFHPHGDSACYEAMVRMAQDFSLRYPLVDGQGNFGSLDGDGAAAYRYTEAKLREIALEVIGEIDEETVDFRENFDNTLVEPEVLPARVPHLLINGASGIAVGMATNIPPHNLPDVHRALIELLADPDISIPKLVSLIKGPDFPTGCSILNSKDELNAIYKTGRGSVRMRGEWKLEKGKGSKHFAIITSVPYALNKATLVEKIAELIVAKKVPQLTDIRDESTEDVRIVLELAADADPELAMAYLFKNTPLESNFNVNLTALVPTVGSSLRPELLSLKDCLQHFLDFREDVTRRKLEFEKRNLLDRIHILEGLVKIFNALDEALKIVRSSTGRTDAATKLAKRFKLTEIQAFAVVDMRIYQLARTNIKDVKAELSEKKKRVAEIDAILKSTRKIRAIIKKDLEALAKAYPEGRRSRIIRDHVEVELQQEDFLVEEEVYAILTRDGWLKRIRQTNELASTRLREGDSILNAHPVSTLDKIAIVSNLGFMYLLPVNDFPSSSGYGDPVQKILKFRDGERIVESYAVQNSQTAEANPNLFEEHGLVLEENDDLVLVSDDGLGFAHTITGLDAIKRSGKRIMKLRAGKQLISAVHFNDNLALVSEGGYGLKIKGKEIPVRQNAALGVQLLGLRKDDKCVGAVSFGRKAKIKLLLGADREKVISADDFEAGRRSLKGRKLSFRGKVSGVFLG